MQIIFPSSYAAVINNTAFQSTSHPTYSSTHDSNVYVDLVDFLSNENKSTKTVAQTIAKSNKYPSFGIFHFEGFNGYESKNRLIQCIKESALLNGTQLTQFNSHRSKNKNSVTLACVHFGTPHKNVYRNKKFVADKVQASNTIIQVSHSGSSTKHNSRNSKFKRSHLDHESVDPLGKNNRTNTSKCGCKFQFCIFYDDTSCHWFLKEHRKKSHDVSLSHHSNHIWVDPVHFSSTKKDLSDIAMQTIKILLADGHPIPNIISHVKSTCRVNVPYHTIYNLRNQAIDDLLIECSEFPSGSSVDKLIQIFKSTTDVSFVYTTHNYNSGFVTYRKNRNENLHHSYSSGLNNTNVGNYFSINSIKNWRDSLRLKDSNDILVCFAWAHDEEIRTAEMYPEYIAADVTFGVNKERRELFLAVGIDGRNKVFTAFRSFIPSKQEQAYTWILNEAMPSLLSNEVLKYNTCISTDQEKSLMDAIDTTMSSSKPAFKHSSFRLDCYHFFTKVWIEKVANKSRDNLNTEECLPIMKNWIMTWFKRLESSYEFEISKHHFNLYLQFKKNCIGNAALEGITKLVHNIVSKQKHLLHFYFKDVCSFDFIGDSIVETANFQLKSGPISVLM